ncbi:uncharacterized protein LOC131306918 [Rhododendron vialii]|uniref:uncharacterized protein LOC131306918 n=1 Tax=Rhododendron vialii TaxID=182163 RepID=UPI0026603EBF|nr:uncharacterized protein LOC131306918 [Rhododendron vialii]
MTRTQAMNEFCKRRPPTFHGDINPVVAETWLNKVKMILRTLGITQDGNRVALATYQLKGEARYWWDLMEATYTIATMTFVEFEALFLDKYFSTPIRLAKEQEFLNLKQGTMTVTQYEAKFEELSRYALTSIPTEDKKAKESEEADFKTQWKKAIGNTGRPIRTQPPNNKRGPYPHKPSNSTQSNQPWETAIPGHGEPQMVGQDIATVQCYNCQAMGHIRRNCPQPQRKRDGSFGN